MAVSWCALLPSRRPVHSHRYLFQGPVIVFNVGVPTIDLRIDWLRPARAGDLVATGRVVKTGRRVSIADVEVHDALGQLVAIGRGLYASPEAGP